MLKSFYLLALCTFMISCNCSKRVTQGESTNGDSDLIEAFIPSSIFVTLMTVEEISFFKVVSVLIEGTSSEYSNKSVLLRNLSKSEIDSFLAFLKSDAAYKWKEYSETIPFDPSKQFVFRSKDGQFNVLTNSETSVISFISLEGQRIIPIQSNFSDFLNNLN